MPNYALILPDGPYEAVVEIAVAADDETAHSLWDGNYDFVVNVTSRDPAVNMGDVYDSGEDSFGPYPGPLASDVEDEILNLVSAYNDLITLLESGNPSHISDGFSMAESNENNNLVTEQPTLWDDLSAIIESYED